MVHMGMQRHKKTQTEHLTLRIDKTTSDKINKVAVRLKSNRSAILRLSLEHFMRDTESGYIRLLPENDQAQHDHSPKKVTVR